MQFAVTFLCKIDPSVDVTDARKLRLCPITRKGQDTARRPMRDGEPASFSIFDGVGQSGQTMTDPVLKFIDSYFYERVSEEPFESVGNCVGVFLHDHTLIGQKQHVLRDARLRETIPGNPARCLNAGSEAVETAKSRG